MFVCVCIFSHSTNTLKVHVREKTILVQCGNGPQRLKWFVLSFDCWVSVLISFKRLGHVGIARYDINNSGELGLCLVLNPHLLHITNLVTNYRSSCGRKN
jgi:hypothetical protein